MQHTQGIFGFDFTIFLTEILPRIDDITINNLIYKNAEIGLGLSNVGIFPFDSNYGDYKLLELNIIADPTYPSLKLMINNLQDTLFINVLFKTPVFTREDIAKFKDNFFVIFDFFKNI